MIECTIVNQKQESQAEIAAIVLAAGGSVRMGRPKQLLPIACQPMVRRVVEAVCSAGFDQVVVVTGAHADEVAEALQDLPVELVTNKAWTKGMSASLRRGLLALRPGIQAALIALADQPALTSQVVSDLVDRYRTTRAPIVAPTYEGRRGNPVIFDRSLFAELLMVEGDKGGRALLDRYASQVEKVELDDPAALFDVDTFEDYERVQRGRAQL
jgi:molybdenum cofactor cytidylyltransferase